MQATSYQNSHADSHTRKEQQQNFKDILTLNGGFAVLDCCTRSTHTRTHTLTHKETVGVASTTAATADLTSTITLHSNIGCSDQAHCLQ